IANPGIAARIAQLRGALRLLEPQMNFSWVPVVGDVSRLPCRVGRGGRHALPAGIDRDLRGWPDIDRALWHAGLQPGDLLDDPKHAARLRPRTIEATARGYRRWLIFLQTEDLLTASGPPAARVTKDNVQRYISAMRDAGCRNSTIVTRISELSTALKILHPESDFGWLTSPGGRWLGSLLPFDRQAIQVPSSKVLYDWGQGMMQAALENPHPDQRRIAYRNGLLMALLAARAPRIQSMACLRLGRHVIQTESGYRLIFEAENIKTRRPLEYHAPAGLSAAIAHYVSVERAELLGGQSHDWFWVDAYGQPLSRIKLTAIIRHCSRQHFGAAFGPHRFRHALGTTAPLVDPAHPGVASAVLGISAHMVEEHYNRAGQQEAAKRFHAAFREERSRSQALAQREFGKWRRG
ncbi:MAG TPA: tyrosine-type recombinase/integrase, partial [Frateuria sp.]|uniref:tyrosine-type recombinase/integrase n=1 Tax=Frateuria sp. TaxID=2211372 RepID=UPI002D7F5AAC